MPTDEVPWLAQARADLGVHEIPGKKHNKRILEMLSEIGHPEVQNDEDSWCATALGSWLVRAGKPTSRPVKLNRTGLSYEDYGTPCEPKLGAISVSTYTKAGKKDWRRHVGLILEVAPTKLKVLGGNQSNQVCETWINRGNVTAVRWPPADNVKPDAPPPVIVATPPAKPVTPSELPQVSRKARWTSRFDKFWQAVSVSSVLASLGLSKQVADQVSKIIADHWLAIIITFAVLCIIFAKWLSSVMAEDVNEGRAIPSGGLPPAK